MAVFRRFWRHPVSIYMVGSRVEERRGLAEATRFPSPLIKPDVRISRIRLSDWLHRGHTAGGEHERHPCPTSPWRHDTASSEGSGPHYAVLHRLAPSHPPSPSSQAHQKSGSFPPPALPGFGGTMTLSDSRVDRMPCSTVEAATLIPHGSPPITQPTVSTCRAPYPDGPVRVHLPAASPNRAAFPILRLGRRP